MRAARGSGPDGLAGMAALIERPEARLLRPLLTVPRARLTASLLALGVRWIDDPSNTDPRFERARLRGGRAGLPRTARTQAASVAPPASGGNWPGRPWKRWNSTWRAPPPSTGPASAASGPICRRGCSAGSSRPSAAGITRRGATASSGRRHGFRAPDGPRKIGKAAGFHAVGMPADAAAGPGQPPTALDCPARKWQDKRRKTGQPLIPAAFFACGGPAAPHVE